MTDRFLNWNLKKFDNMVTAYEEGIFNTTAEVNNRYKGVPYSDVMGSHVNLYPGLLNLRDFIRSSQVKFQKDFKLWDPIVIVDNSFR